MEQYQAKVSEPTPGNYVLVAETGVIGLVFPEPEPVSVEPPKDAD